MGWLTKTNPIVWEQGEAYSWRKRPDVNHIECFDNVIGVLVGVCYPEYGGEDDWSARTLDRGTLGLFFSKRHAQDAIEAYASAKKET